MRRRRNAPATAKRSSKSHQTTRAGDCLKHRNPKRWSQLRKGGLNITSILLSSYLALPADSLLGRDLGEGERQLEFAGKFHRSPRQAPDSGRSLPPAGRQSRLRISAVEKQAAEAATSMKAVRIRSTASILTHDPHPLVQ
ncbi:hypothetical protein SMa0640 (plasmid) [Sinorhizobium meliloti 1021]|uniref:Uncharacterized protein n=1 Tax=Rhizobium meliloti (strain 1021) TaxID=266834 RepID=Q92ZW0_RHIME|nr:hypothetical protein SMa0640 [Sinorhizobium meliloti 1021]